MRGWLLGLVAVLLPFSGCIGGPDGPQTEEEAQQVTKDAVEAFSAGFFNGEGDLRKVTGTFQASEGGGMGRSEAEFVMEIGRDDTMTFEIETGGGGMSLHVLIYCSSDIMVLTLGDESYASRPKLGESCLGEEASDEVPLDFDEMDLPDLDVVINPDGSVTATYDNASGTFVFQVDRDGRLTEIQLDSEDGDGTFVMEYGSRRSLDEPEAEKRMPAEIRYDMDWGDDDIVWTVDETSQDLPLSEFEMRFEEDEDVVARYPLSDGQHTDGGYGFEFSDEDNNGKISEGDVFTFTAADGSSALPVLYDEWADANVGDNPIPSLGAVGAILAVALVLLVRRLR